MATYTNLEYFSWQLSTRLFALPISKYWQPILASLLSFRPDSSMDTTFLVEYFHFRPSVCRLAPVGLARFARHTRIEELSKNALLYSVVLSGLVVVLWTC